MLYAIQGCGFVLTPGQIYLTGIRNQNISNGSITQPPSPLHADWVKLLVSPGKWSDSAIEAVVDPTTSGFYDSPNSTLRIITSDNRTLWSPGFRFFATRAAQTLSSIPQGLAIYYPTSPNTLSLSGGNNFAPAHVTDSAGHPVQANFLSPSAASLVLPGHTFAVVRDDNSAEFPASTDILDLTSAIEPNGFAITSVQPFYANLPLQACPAKFSTSGNWSPRITGVDKVSVSWQEQSCGNNGVSAYWRPDATVEGPIGVSAFLIGGDFSSSNAPNRQPTMRRKVIFVWMLLLAGCLLLGRGRASSCRYSPRSRADGCGGSIASAGYSKHTNPGTAAGRVRKITHEHTRQCKNPANSKTKESQNFKSRSTPAILSTLQEQRAYLAMQSRLISKPNSSLSAPLVKDYGVGVSLSSRKDSNPQPLAESPVSLPAGTSAPAPDCRAPMIRLVNGKKTRAAFTPQAPENSAEIEGCFFGNVRGKLQLEPHPTVLGQSALPITLQIDSALNAWSDTKIDAYLDPGLSGIPDYPVTLVIYPGKGQRMELPGCFFVAVRGDNAVVECYSFIMGKTASQRRWFSFH